MCKNQCLCVCMCLFVRRHLKTVHHLHHYHHHHFRKLVNLLKSGKSHIVYLWDDITVTERIHHLKWIEITERMVPLYFLFSWTYSHKESQIVCTKWNLVTHFFFCICKRWFLNDIEKNYHFNVGSQLFLYKSVTSKWFEWVFTPFLI